jgi:hypothetical protein
MTASRSLPDRPSLESLRKQAKKLARDIATGDAAAIARARAQPMPDKSIIWLGTRVVTSGHSLLSRDGW